MQTELKVTYLYLPGYIFNIIYQILLLEFTLIIDIYAHFVFLE
jgi:hypothetical protein